MINTPNTPAKSGFPRWTLSTGHVVLPEERLSFPQTIVAGLQHVVAMFGSTTLAPLLMGFDPNISIFFSGVATLLFFVIVRGRVPSYLGSSFSFIAVIIAATGFSGSGANLNIPVALGGIIAAGALYALVGLIVMAVGYRWIERLIPPVITGTIVAIIGLNLAPVAIKDISGSGFSLLIGLSTVLLVSLCAVYTRGLFLRLPILVGGLLSYGLYYLLANGMGYGAPIDFTGVRSAAWFGLPPFQAPVFTLTGVSLIAPVAIILVAENLGHIKAIGAMTGKNMDSYLGRAFLGDGLATMISGAGGGTGMTTYAENMGVMAITRNFSTLTFVVAAGFALLFGLSPKFGAVIHTIPVPVLGGLSFIVFGLITATAGRIWTENRVDFTNSRNLLAAGIALVMGAGNLTITIGQFSLGGIATATFSALLLYHILSHQSQKTLT